MNWRTALAMFATLSASVVLADDFKTINGKEYKNATVNRVEPDGIVLETKSGISKVYFIELPKDAQKRFGYDTDKIEAEQAAERAAARAAEEKRVEEQKAAQQERAKKRGKIESKIESTVSVERQITDELVHDITWSMTLSPRDLSFIHFIGSFSPTKLSFSNPEDAADVLAKFVEWDETARRNNAEPFRKKINDQCTFEFKHGERGGFSELECYGKAPSGAFSGWFSRDDIDKLNQLLKQLPEAKAELASKIAKAQKEEALFK